jgi:transcriptional regulator with XRE-family HTH domain
MESHTHLAHFDPDAFGSRLRKIREEHKLTQTELADLLETSQGNIAHLETGKRSPGAETILQIFTHFRKHFVFLLTGESGANSLELEEILSNPSINFAELVKLNEQCFTMETECGCIESSVIVLIKQLKSMARQMDAMADTLQHSLEEMD